MDREVGRKKIKVKTTSKTHGELYRWFESFNRFINRPDVDEIVDDPITHMSKEDLKMSDALYHYTDHIELQTPR